VVAFIGANDKPISFLTQFTDHSGDRIPSRIPDSPRRLSPSCVDDLSKAYDGVPVGFSPGLPAGDINSKACFHSNHQG